MLHGLEDGHLFGVGELLDLVEGGFADAAGGNVDDSK